MKSEGRADNNTLCSQKRGSNAEDRMKKTLRLLFVIDSLGFGGAERQLVELVKGLLVRDTYEIHVVSLMKIDQGYAHILALLGLEVHCFPRAYKYDVLGPLFSLIRYIRESRIDLVHTFMNMGSLFGAVAARLTGRPVVCSAIRDARDKSFREKYLKRFLACLADRYVANSQAGLANRFQKIRPHFHVVYNGVDFNRFKSVGHDDREILRNELELSGCSHIVGMVGSLTRHKDQASLLQAAPAILKDFPDVVFLLVGDGETRAALEAQSRAQGLTKRVVFAGFRKDVDRFYPLMDVCVLLTNSQVHLEGIANVLVEAMACGVPVVATAGGGTDELLGDGRYGLCVPPHKPDAVATAIVGLLADPVSAADRVVAARASVFERFGLERYVDDYENLYLEIQRTK